MCISGEVKASAARRHRLSYLRPLGFRREASQQSLVVRRFDRWHAKATVAGNLGFRQPVERYLVDEISRLQHPIALLGYLGHSSSLVARDDAVGPGLLLMVRPLCFQ